MNGSSEKQSVLIYALRLRKTLRTVFCDLNRSTFFVLTVTLILMFGFCEKVQAENDFPLTQNRVYQRLLRSPYSTGLMDRFCISIAQENSHDDWRGMFNSLQGNQTNAHIVAGRLAFRRTEYELAEFHFLTAKENIPNSFKLTSLLARTYRNLGKLEDSILYLKSAASLTNQTREKIEIYKELITLLCWLEDDERISFLTIQIQKELESQTEAIDEIIDAFERLGLLDHAIKLSRKRLQQETSVEKTFSLRLKLASLLGHAGRQDESLNEFEKLLLDSDQLGQYSIEVLNEAVSLFKLNNEQLKLFRYLVAKINGKKTFEKNTPYDRRLFELAIDSAEELYNFERALKILDLAIQREEDAEETIAWLKRRVSLQIRLADISGLEKSFSNLENSQDETPDDLFLKLDWLEKIQAQHSFKNKELDKLKSLESKVIQKLFRKASKKPSIFSQLAKRHYSVGQVQNAVDSISHALKIVPENSRWRFEQVKYFLALNLHKEAKASWNKIINQKPRNIALILALVVELRNAELNQDAIELLKYALEKQDIHNFELKLELAGLLADQKAYKQAQAILSEIRTQNESEWAQLFKMQFAILQAQGKIESQLADLEYQIDQIDSLYRRRQLVALLEYSQTYQTAIRVQKKILLKFSESDRENERLARLQIASQKYNDAIVTYRSLLQSDSSKTIVHLRQIFALQNLMNDREGALETQKQIASLTSSSFAAKVELLSNRLEIGSHSNREKDFVALCIEAFQDEYRTEDFAKLVKKHGSVQEIELLEKVYKRYFQANPELSKKQNYAIELTEIAKRKQKEAKFLECLLHWRNEREWKRGSTLLVAEVLETNNQGRLAWELLKEIEAFEEDVVLNSKLADLSIGLEKFDEAIHYVNLNRKQLAYLISKRNLNQNLLDKISDRSLAKLHLDYANQLDSRMQWELANLNYELGLKLSPEAIFEFSSDFLFRSKLPNEKLSDELRKLAIDSIGRTNFRSLKTSPLKIIETIKKTAGIKISKKNSNLYEKYWNAFPDYRSQIFSQNSDIDFDEVPKLFQEIYKSFSGHEHGSSLFSLLNIQLDSSKTQNQQSKISLLTRFLDHLEKREHLISLINDIGEQKDGGLRTISLLARFRIFKEPRLIGELIEIVETHELSDTSLNVIGIEITKSSKDQAVRYYEHLVKKAPNYYSPICKQLLNLYYQLDQKTEVVALLFSLRHTSAIDFTDKVDHALYLLGIQNSITKELLKLNASFEALWIASFMHRHFSDLGKGPLKEEWQHRRNLLIDAARKRNLENRGHEE